MRTMIPDQNPLTELSRQLLSHERHTLWSIHEQDSELEITELYVEKSGILWLKNAMNNN